MTESDNPQAERVPDEQMQEIHEDEPPRPLSVPQEQKKQRWKLLLTWRQRRQRRQRQQELLQALQRNQVLLHREQALNREQALQSLQAEREQMVLERQQQELQTQHEALRRQWLQVQEEQRREHPSSRSLGDVVGGDQDPSLDVHAQRDAAFYDEVRRAVGRGTPTLLLGTSTKSLERSLAKLTAVHRN